MEKITLSLETVNQVLGYLGTRPYQDVFQIINAIQNEAQDQIKGVENGGKVDSESN